jgi:peptide/nickel transport system substrate-binding protein
MKKIKRIAAVLFFLVIVFFGACGGGKKEGSLPAEAAAYRDEANIAVSQEASYLDLHRDTAIVVRDMTLGSVWEKLITVNGEFEPVPELCERFEISDDAREFTFYLRRGVKFHNGDTMDADDVAASMNRWIENSSSGRAVAGTSRFEKIDDYTVKISTGKPALLLLNIIAYASTPIMPIEAIQNTDSNGFIRQEYYIGTGPYKYVEWKQDQYVLFEKFGDYTPYGTRGEPMSGWAGYKEPKINRLYYRIVKEDATRIAGLQTGQFDLIFSVPADNFEMVNNLPGIVTQKYEAGESAMVFNKKEGPAKNIYFRQAVNAATNADDLLRVIYGNMYVLNSSYLGSNQGFWVSNAGSENYNNGDPEKAKELLKKAGYKGEVFRILTTPAVNLDKMSMVFQQQLEKAGIRSELTVVDLPTLLEWSEDPSRYDIYTTLYFGSDLPTAKLYYDAVAAGWADDAKLQSLLYELNSATTLEDAKRIWTDMQGYSWEYLPILHLGHFISANAWTDKFEGLNTYNGVYFWSAALKK